MTLYNQLNDALVPHGFILRGGFRLKNEDREKLGADNETLVLIGNAGPAFFRHFSAERPDGPHPMDAWTRQVLSGFADIFGVTALFPFEGPPYHPFQQWAQRCEPVYPSPIGPLIHPKFGLWHAYRGAFLFDSPIDLPAKQTAAFPCESCTDKPCLSACPAEAFTGGNYDVPACTGYLKSPEGGDCMTLGCRARRACPVGQKYVYGPDQAHFHMQKFLANNG